MTSGGALLLGALVFLLDGRALAALVCAVAAHELGHVLALVLLGGRVEGLTLAATGPVLHCASQGSGWRDVLCALAGPALGALAFFLLRQRWQLLAEMSAVLSLVNLLPVLPLDGGRALAAALDRFACADAVQSAVRALVLAVGVGSGVWCAAKGLGFAPLLFAFWLLVLPGDTCKSPRDVVK